MAESHKAWSVSFEAEIVSHRAELLLISLHVALVRAGLFDDSLMVNHWAVQFFIHFLKPGLDSFMRLVHFLNAALDGLLLIWTQPLVELFARLLHGAHLLLDLRILLSGLLDLEAASLGCACHFTCLGASLLHGSRAGAELITLLVSGQGTKLVAVLLGQFIAGAIVGTVTVGVFGAVAGSIERATSLGLGGAGSRPLGLCLLASRTMLGEEDGGACNGK